MHSESDLLIDDLEPRSIPGVMNAEALSRLLGVSETTARGVGVKLPGKGRWDVAATLRVYLDRLREHAGRAGRPAASGDTEALRAEKLRLTRAQADKEETRVKREAGELVEVESVTREWSNLLRDMRNAMLAVPSRCGAGLPHLTATDIATIDREIRKALEGLTNGN